MVAASELDRTGNARGNSPFPPRAAALRQHFSRHGLGGLRTPAGIVVLELGRFGAHVDPDAAVPGDFLKTTPLEN
jgi:hypothetical protein